MFSKPNMSLNVVLFFLQPLMDNLESQTYEIFEKDPVKYSQYQKVSFLLVKTNVLVNNICYTFMLNTKIWLV